MVKHRRRGELGNTLQVGILHIIGRVKAASGEQGILDAGSHEVPKAHLYVEIVQPFQQTVRHVIGEVVQVLPISFTDHTTRLLHKLPADIVFLCRAVLTRKGFRNGCMMLLAQLPQVRHFCTAYRARVAHIKDVLQIGPAAAVLVNQRDAL